jgi:hypothetical protein
MPILNDNNWLGDAQEAERAAAEQFAEQPFTVDELRRIMTEARVLRGAQALRDDALQNLAARLTTLRYQAISRGVLALFDARAERCADALDKLAQVLPLLRDNHNHEPRDGELLQRLIDVVDLARGRPWARRRPKKGRKTHNDASRARGWHDIARDLAICFLSAGVSSGQMPGFSNEGPLPRFVTAIIPHITGERPTQAAVARQLQRHFWSKVG